MLATKSVFIPDSSLWSLLLSKVLTDLKDLMVLIYTYLFYYGATRNRALQSNNRQNEVAEKMALAIIVPLRLRPPVCIPAGTKKRPEWISFLMWCHQESNRGHKDFQSFALPTELWHLAVSREKRVQKYCFFLIYANIFAFFCEKGSIFLFFSLILTTFAPEKSLNDHFYATTTSYCPCP